MLLLMRCTNVRVSSVLFFHNNENLPSVALKFRKIIWLLQNLGKLLAADLMINALGSIWNIVRNSLHASVRQRAPCCSWLHRLELLRQAQEKDGNSGQLLTGKQPVAIEVEPLPACVPVQPGIELS